LAIGVASFLCGVLLAVAIWQHRISYLVIDQSDLGGTVRKYPRNKLTMTQPIELPFVGRIRRTEYTKEELLRLWEDIVRQARVEIRPKVRLLGLTRQPDHLGGAFPLVSKLAWGRCDLNSFDHPHVPFALAGAHRSLACEACHSDVHCGQFQRNEKQDCQRCHGSTENWTADRFDHNREARFKLEGVHANLACSACHPSVRQPDGQGVVQYKPLGIRCEDCHGFTSK